jgi:hypothetical protein
VPPLSETAVDRRIPSSPPHGRGRPVGAPPPPPDPARVSALCSAARGRRWPRIVDLD